MKFNFIFKNLLITLLVFSAVSYARKVKSRVELNDMYVFARSISQVIFSRENVNFEKCLPPSWSKESKETMEHKDLDVMKSEFADDFKNDTSVFEKLKNVLSQSIQVFCSIKQLREKALHYYVKNASSRRLFYQKRKSRKNKRRAREPNIDTWLSDSVGIIASSAASVANGSIKIYSKDEGRDRDEAKLLNNDITNIKAKIIEGVKNVLKPSVSILIQMRPKLTKFFKSNLFRKILKFLDCLLNMHKNKDSEPGKRIERFLKFSKDNQGNDKTFFEMAITSVCFSLDFKQAIDYMLIGLAGNGNDRWSFIGRYLGKMVYILGYEHLQR